MNQLLLIPFQLPSLNKMILANRTNWQTGAALKRKTEQRIAWAIKAAGLKPVTYPCIVHMTFEEPNRRRDCDNVESAKKFILDALVKTGILKGDSPRYVAGCPSWTRYVEGGAQVLVTIIEDEREDALRERLQRCVEIVKGGENGCT